MEKVFVTNLRKIKKAKKDLEKTLHVKLTVLDDGIEIEGKEGEAFSEYIAGLVLESLDYGFDMSSALFLKNENYMLEKINLKDHVRSSRVRTVLGRVIGERGRTKEIIAEMTGCFISIQDSTIAIIGDTEDVALAVHALRSLINGSPHAKVYAYLERNRKLKKLSEKDYGLKIPKRKEPDTKAF